MALPTTVNRRGSYDPFTELQREFDTVLNRVFGGTPQSTSGRRSAPYAVDVHEDDNHLYFEVELPGFKRDEIDITLDNNTLTISAERSESRQHSSDGRAPEGQDKAQKGTAPPAARRETLLNERRFSYFSRSFTLPPTVSTENVSARVEDGVLYLTLNKREETKPRKIEVR
jgi:HSP20 family protein